VREAGAAADILVYVAGGVRGQQPRPLEEVSADDFDAIIDANLKGAFLFAKAVAPAMKTKGRAASSPSPAAPASPPA